MILEYLFLVCGEQSARSHIPSYDDFTLGMGIKVMLLTVCYWL